MNALWLIAVDGSLPALRAVDHVLREAARDTIAPAIMLINVQPPCLRTSPVSSATASSRTTTVRLAKPHWPMLVSDWTLAGLRTRHISWSANRLRRLSISPESSTAP